MFSAADQAARGEVSLLQFVHKQLHGSFRSQQSTSDARASTTQSRCERPQKHVHEHGVPQQERLLQPSCVRLGSTAKVLKKANIRVLQSCNRIEFSGAMHGVSHAKVLQ